MATKTIHSTKADKAFDIFNYIFMTILLIIVIYPLWFIIIASFSDPNAVNGGRVWLWPTDIMLDGYERIFSMPKIWMGYWNTIQYTFVGTIISVAITVAGGYSLSKKYLPGVGMLMGLMTFTMFFNGGLIPTYLVVKRLNMLDTLWAMVLPGAVSIWNLIMCRTFFKSTIPMELEEAAELDGCGQIGFFFRIAIPLTKALMAIMILYYMVGYWNEYFKGIIYLEDAQKHPLQLILRDILITGTTNDMTQDIRDRIQKQKTAELLKYGVIIVSTVPLLMAYPFVQKFFIKGVMIGSIKG